MPKSKRAAPHVIAVSTDPASRVAPDNPAELALAYLRRLTVQITEGKPGEPVFEHALSAVSAAHRFDFGVNPSTVVTRRAREAWYWLAMVVQHHSDVDASPHILHRMYKNADRNGLGKIPLDDLRDALARYRVAVPRRRGVVRKHSVESPADVVFSLLQRHKFTNATSPRSFEKALRDAAENEQSLRDAAQAKM